MKVRELKWNKSNLEDLNEFWPNLDDVICNLTNVLLIKGKFILYKLVYMFNHNTYIYIKIN